MALTKTATQKWKSAKPMNPSKATELAKRIRNETVEACQLDNLLHYAGVPDTCATKCLTLGLDSVFQGGTPIGGVTLLGDGLPRLRETLNGEFVDDPRKRILGSSAILFQGKTPASKTTGQLATQLERFFRTDEQRDRHLRRIGHRRPPPPS
jgi:hypothetical protein